MEEITPLSILNNGHSVFQSNHGYHYHSPYRARTDVIRANTIRNIEHTSNQLLDTYDIEHGLTPAELRVLLKIVAKSYHDCGRKRGAILRYIKYYMEQDVPLGNKRIYNKLKAMDEGSRNR